MSDLRRRIDAMERIYMEGTLLIEKLEMKRERLEYFAFKERDDAFWSGTQDTECGVRIETIPRTDVLATKRTMQDYNNVEISVGRWFELFKLAEKRSLPVTGSIILTYHTEHPMEQFFKSTCELEVMLPVRQEARRYEDVKSFGGFRAATILHFGHYDRISTTHLKLLKWLETHELKLNGKISEEYIVSPVDLSTKSGYVTKIIAPIP